MSAAEDHLQNENARLQGERRAALEELQSAKADARNLNKELERVREALNQTLQETQSKIVAEQQTQVSLKFACNELFEASLGIMPFVIAWTRQRANNVNNEHSLQAFIAAIEQAREALK
jgi:hypothetical protein